MIYFGFFFILLFYFTILYFLKVEMERTDFYSVLLASAMDQSSV